MGKIRPKAQRFDPHRSGTKYGVLDELVGYAIRRAQLVLTEEFDARFRAFGMTTQRMSALVLIAENRNLKQTELADLMGIARSGVLAIVAELERQGLVTRGTNATDQRAHALCLTDRGRAFLPGLILQVRSFDNETTADLSAAERDVLMALSRRIGGAIRKIERSS
jgi:DNA-binding MarR family transcriptional regulator